MYIVNVCCCTQHTNTTHCTVNKIPLYTLEWPSHRLLLLLTSTIPGMCVHVTLQNTYNILLKAVVEVEGDNLNTQPIFNTDI